RNSVNGAFAFALVVTLALQLGRDIVEHRVQVRDGGAAKLVAVVELGQVVGLDGLKLVAVDQAIEVEVAVGEPLGQALDSALAALGETVEEQVIAVNGQGDRLGAAVRDGHAGRAVDAAGAQGCRSGDPELKIDALRVVAGVFSGKLTVGLALAGLALGGGWAGLTPRLGEGPPDQVGPAGLDHEIEVCATDVLV